MTQDDIERLLTSFEVPRFAGAERRAEIAAEIHEDELTAAMHQSIPTYRPRPGRSQSGPVDEAGRRSS